MSAPETAEYRETESFLGKRLTARVLSSSPSVERPSLPRSPCPSSSSVSLPERDEELVLLESALACSRTDSSLLCVDAAWGNSAVCCFGLCLLVPPERKRLMERNTRLRGCFWVTVGPPACCDGELMVVIATVAMLDWLSRCGDGGGATRSADEPAGGAHELDGLRAHTE